MKKIFTLCLLLLSIFAQAQSGNGHTPTTTLSYTPSGYSFAPMMRQNVASSSADANITAGSAADIFLNFIYDTTNQPVYLVYTTNGTEPSKTNGTVVSATFSNYAEPNRTWIARIPASQNTVGTTIKYIAYISSNNGPLANGYARISPAGYQTSWNNEGTQPGFSYTVLGPLPVTLVSFNARPASNRMVSLDWATTTERNNAYFEVERSRDAQTFTPIGRVTGKGNTNARQTYLFTDEAPAMGVNYYRLKQTDTDGTFSYSPIRAVAIRTNGELLVLGNPAAGQVRVAGVEPGTLLELLDLNGQVRTRAAATEADAALDVRELPTGTYLLRAVEPTGVQTRRVLVAQ
jgi:hypothetical protein